jgi:hypothetical protein
MGERVLDVISAVKFLHAANNRIHDLLFDAWYLAG